MMNVLSEIRVDEDERAKEHGFRNFISFAFIVYYGRKLSLKKSSSIIGISHHKLRNSLLKRNWKTRNKKQVIRPKPKKRRMGLRDKIRRNTPFIFPWCCLYVYYHKYFLTTYEVASQVGISQSSVVKLLKKYKIPRRKQKKIF